jgi:hypothetical protein
VATLVACHLAINNKAAMHIFHANTLLNNGDGLDDLIVGAWGSQIWTGKSYVVFGKANSSAINLSAIVDADNPT